MNQILMMEDKKKKKSKSRSSQIEIANIVKFFAIVIMIFGLCLIGQGSYAIYKDSIGKNTKDMPSVNITRVNDTARVSVKGIHNITYLKYNWNNGEETSIPVDGTAAEEVVLLPNGNSILHITIEEENGRAVKYAKEFILDGLDITKPSINIEQETQSNIKITATDETKMAYITYQINDGEEIRIDKTDSEDKTMNYILKLEKGENIVTITAVDDSGNIETLEKTIIVSKKPTMELRTDEDNLYIIIKDESGIKDVEVNLNGVVYAAKDVNQKEIRVPLKLKEGTNSVSVKVTNVDGLTAEGVKELNYAH